MNKFTQISYLERLTCLRKQPTQKPNQYSINSLQINCLFPDEDSKFFLKKKKKSFWPLKSMKEKKTSYIIPPKSKNSEVA
jgi:hypothetical protein